MQIRMAVLAQWQRDMLISRYFHKIAAVGSQIQLKQVVAPNVACPTTGPFCTEQSLQDELVSNYLSEWSGRILWSCSGLLCTLIPLENVLSHISALDLLQNTPELWMMLNSTCFLDDLDYKFSYTGSSAIIIHFDTFFICSTYHNFFRFSENSETMYCGQLSW